MKREGLFVPGRKPFKVLEHAFMLYILAMQSLDGVAPCVWH